jgi:hypothetical protein
VEIRRTAEGGVVVSGLDRVLYGVLRGVPDAADPRGNGRALDRLYPPPADSEEGQLVNDWHEFVQPDLQHLFESANETVRRDLAHASDSSDGMTVRIASEHVGAWISSLNQARLVLAARHNFQEADMDSELPLAPLTPRDFALLQIHLYGFIQESLIRLVDEWP